MWWKIYFWFIIIFSVATSISIAFNSIPNGFMIFHMVLFYGELVGLFTYIFRKKLLTKVFWKYFLWLNVLLDFLVLLYAIFPTVPLLSFANVFFYKTKILYETRLIGAVIGTIIELPVFYALYRLSQGKFYEPKVKEKKIKKPEKQKRFRWGMLQMALWGYSLILTLYILIFSFIPSSGSGNTKNVKDVTDIFYGVAMYAPMLIFWFWVVVRYKEYYWNWWRTTLVANALLYSGSIIFGVLVPGPDGGSSGIDIVSVLILVILLMSLYVFGREQFTTFEKK